MTTDDAYVNSHATQVAPRITENVREVRVDNNDFVKKGNLLIVLDDALEQVRVREAKAALDVASKTAEQALAKAQADVAAARANRFKLASAISEVKQPDRQPAGRRGRLKEAEAAEKLAATEARRYSELATRKSVTQEQADVRRTDYEQARAPRPPGAGAGPQHPGRAGITRGARGRQAARRRPARPGSAPFRASWRPSGNWPINLAELGVPIPSYYDTPQQFIDEIRPGRPAATSTG